MNNIIRDLLHWLNDSDISWRKRFLDIIKIRFNVRHYSDKTTISINGQIFKGGTFKLYSLRNFY